MRGESNWWEHFFEGLSVKLWLGALSPEHTDREADAIARLLCARRASNCWMCRAEAAGCRWPWLSAATASRPLTCQVSSWSTHARAMAQTACAGNPARCVICRGPAASTGFLCREQLRLSG
jgi:hypothetical protein